MIYLPKTCTIIPITQTQVPNHWVLGPSGKEFKRGLGSALNPRGASIGLSDQADLLGQRAVSNQEFFVQVTKLEA